MITDKIVKYNIVTGEWFSLSDSLTEDDILRITKASDAIVKYYSDDNDPSMDDAVHFMLDLRYKYKLSILNTAPGSEYLSNFRTFYIRDNDD